MSLADQRADIAAALSTVDDVTGHQYRPRLLSTGAAWPQLVQLSRAAAQGPDLQANWRVWLVLPGDEEQATVWMDAHIADLDVALADFGYVESIDPAVIKTDSGDINSVQIMIRREA